VSFKGEFFAVDSASVGPLPAKPLDIWLGGSAPGALRRTGRLGDGWLASLLTPEEAAAGRQAIQEAADAAGREVEPDHFGLSLAVALDGIPAELARAVRQRRPGPDPATLVATSWDDARRLIEAYVAAGLSKFVIRPAATPTSLGQFIDDFAQEMLPLQN
jgi:probable F420-dependent oxidoreductase